MTAATLVPVTRRVGPARPLVIDVYARISKDYDGDGRTRSVDSQVDDCLFAIDEHADVGWTVGEVFRDHARSAWNPRVVREQWDALMARLESGAADGVIVYDLTRFTRKPVEGERLIALAERGVVVASIQGTYDLTDADRRSHFRNDMTAAARSPTRSASAHGGGR